MPLWLRLCDFIVLLMYITLAWFLSAYAQGQDWSMPAMILGGIAYGVFMIITLNWILTSIPTKYSKYFRDDYKKDQDTP